MSDSASKGVAQGSNETAAKGVAQGSNETAAKGVVASEAGKSAPATPRKRTATKKKSR